MLNDIKKKKIINISGITLIALVITIVVLIILAAVAINLSLGNNGIFNRAKEARKKHLNGQLAESAEIDKVSNEIDSHVGANSRDTVTISQEEYEIIKPKSLGRATLLMKSSNNNLTRTTLDLKSFTNSFEEDYNTYFTYDAITGEIKAKKSGWYFINAELDIRNAYYFTDTQFYLTINDVDIKILERIIS